MKITITAIAQRCARYLLRPALSAILFFLSSLYIFAQHPGFRWERVNYDRAQMVDVLTDASGKVHSVGFMTGEDPPLSWYEDPTYSNGYDFWFMHYVKTRHTTDGVEEFRTFASPGGASANILFNRPFVKNRSGQIFNIQIHGYGGYFNGGLRKLSDDTYYAIPLVETMGLSDMYYPITAAVDSATNGFVVLGVYAVSASSEITYELKLHRFNSAGELLGMTTYQRTPLVAGRFKGTKPIGMVIDRSGNIFVSAENYIGQTGAGNPRIEQTLLKFNRSGVLTNSDFFNYGNTLDRASADRITELSVDRLGNVYAVGSGNRYSTTGSPTQPFAFITKYNNACARQWTARTNYTTGARALNSKVIVVNPNVIYHAFTHNTETILSKYTTSNVPVWTSNTADETYSELRDIERDVAGNIYMVKSSVLGIRELRSPGALRYGYALLKYDNFGNVVWSTAAPESSAKYMINKICVDNDNLYLAGYRQSPTLTGGVTISYALDAFYLPDPPWYGVEPDIFLHPYGSFNLTLKASLSRGWSWTEASMGWSQRTGYPGALPTYTASEIENNQTVWQASFAKPTILQLPATQQVRRFVLTGNVANQASDIFRIDDNLARNGATEVRLSGVSNTQTLSLKILTDGASIPVKLSAFTKNGTLHWSKNYTAPVDVVISEKLSQATSTLTLTTTSGNTAMAYFPNPSNGTFEVSVSKDTKLPVDITVLDMQGTKVHSARLDGTNRLLLQMPNAKPGLYILSVKGASLDVQELIQVR